MSTLFFFACILKSSFNNLCIVDRLALCSWANFLALLCRFLRIFSFTLFMRFLVRTDRFLPDFFCISTVPSSLNHLIVRSMNFMPIPIFSSFRKMSIFLKPRLCKSKTKWRFASILIVTQTNTEHKCALAQVLQYTSKNLMVLCRVNCNTLCGRTNDVKNTDSYSGPRLHGLVDGVNVLLNVKTVSIWQLVCLLICHSLNDRYVGPSVFPCILTPVSWPVSTVAFKFVEISVVNFSLDFSNKTRILNPNISDLYL